MADKILNTGLDALLGDVAAPNTQSIKEIELNQIKPNRFQPRQSFDEQKINELSQSIAKHGILSPILVRETGAGGYELIAGERRLRAAKQAGLIKAPCMVDSAEDQLSLELALIENLQREDLNSMDQARGLLRLQREFNLTQEELGASVGKSRSTVTNLLRLLNLTVEVQSMLEEGKIEMGHARSLLSLAEADQLECAKRVVSESMSVRQCEALVATFSNAKKTKNPQAKSKDPNTKLLEKELSELLGSAVQITHNSKGRGKLVVNFKNLDALQGVLDKIKS